MTMSVEELKREFLQLNKNISPCAVDFYKSYNEKNGYNGTFVLLYDFIPVGASTLSEKDIKELTEKCGKNPDKIFDIFCEHFSNNVKIINRLTNYFVFLSAKNKQPTLERLLKLFEKKEEKNLIEIDYDKPLLQSDGTILGFVVDENGKIGNVPVFKMHCKKQTINSEFGSISRCLINDRETDSQYQSNGLTKEVVTNLLPKLCKHDYIKAIVSPFEIDGAVCVAVKDANSYTREDDFDANEKVYIKTLSQEQMFAC